MKTETDELAKEIIKEIEREDFQYAVKKYFIFRLVLLIKEFRRIKEEWWDRL